MTNNNSNKDRYRYDPRYEDEFEDDDELDTSDYNNNDDDDDEFSDYKYYEDWEKMIDSDDDNESKATLRINKDGHWTDINIINNNVLNPINSLKNQWLISSCYPQSGILLYEYPKKVSDNDNGNNLGTYQYIFNYIYRNRADIKKRIDEILNNDKDDLSYTNRIRYIYEIMTEDSEYSIGEFKPYMWNASLEDRSEINAGVMSKNFNNRDDVLNGCIPLVTPFWRNVIGSWGGKIDKSVMELLEPYEGDGKKKGFLINNRVIDKGILDYLGYQSAAIVTNESITAIINMLVRSLNSDVEYRYDNNSDNRGGEAANNDDNDNDNDVILDFLNVSDYTKKAKNVRISYNGEKGVDFDFRKNKHNEGDGQEDIFYLLSDYRDGDSDTCDDFYCKQKLSNVRTTRESPTIIYGDNNIEGIDSGGEYGRMDTVVQVYQITKVINVKDDYKYKSVVRCDEEYIFELYEMSPESYNNWYNRSISIRVNDDCYGDMNTTGKKSGGGKPAGHKNNNNNTLRRNKVFSLLLSCDDEVRRLIKGLEYLRDEYYGEVMEWCKRIVMENERGKVDE